MTLSMEMTIAMTQQIIMKMMIKKARWQNITLDSEGVHDFEHGDDHCNDLADDYDD